MLLALAVVDLSFLREGRFVLLPIDQVRLSGFLRVSAEEDPLAEFPGFDAGEEEKGRDDDNRPLPGNHFVLENHAIDDGDVESRKDGDETEDDGPEEEFVPANVIDPKCRMMCQPLNPWYICRVFLACC